ncbi:hypothetical protein B4U80_14031 [Leptotrombidium deliense]|uniref:BPTI/Kunitz inhibitor domain-containing protein n=1 Tax=Leptotrombidium deliense TaxID=299467 RepID=A0A443S4M9_9ACAR|nr:hypothetical protein B4U80_14031 [Leptotrombidium deliense]
MTNIQKVKPFHSLVSLNLNKSNTVSLASILSKSKGKSSKVAEKKKTTAKSSNNALQRNEGKEVSGKKLGASESPFKSSEKPAAVSRSPPKISHDNPPSVENENNNLGQTSSTVDPRDVTEKRNKPDTSNKNEVEGFATLLHKLCHSDKPYSYCTPGTEQRDFWYYDPQSNSCKIFKYCVQRRLKEKYLKENRFRKLSTCESLCKK